MYFWENNYERALQWAGDKKTRGEIETPAVLGAVLYLGHCCDLTDSKNINILSNAYRDMAEIYESENKPLPQNRDLPHDKHKGRILRYLDCTVIEFMHDKIEKKAQQDISQNGFSETKPFDSTRGIFTEGGPAFEGSGIQSKTHTQICIRNLNCLQGFFLPRKEIDFNTWLVTNKPRIAA